MLNFEIFFDDLKPEAQQELLETFGLSSADEMNWETLPIAVIDIEEDENDRD